MYCHQKWNLHDGLRLVWVSCTFLDINDHGLHPLAMFVEDFLVFGSFDASINSSGYAFDLEKVLLDFVQVDFERFFFFQGVELVVEKIGERGYVLIDCTIINWCRGCGYLPMSNQQTQYSFRSNCIKLSTYRNAQKCCRNSYQSEFHFQLFCLTAKPKLIAFRKLCQLILYCFGVMIAIWDIFNYQLYRLDHSSDCYCLL